MRKNNSLLLSFVLMLVVSTQVRADYFDDIGYTALRAEFGESLQIAVGVPVMIVESGGNTDSGVVTYAPNASHAEFRGKKITVGEGGPRVYAPFSSHATEVGLRFFGLRSSVSPGVGRVASHLTDNWYGSTFLRLGETRQPKVSSSRVASHAWVGLMNWDRPGISPSNTATLRRLDWLVETDEFIHVVGFNGFDKTPLLADGFNVLSVKDTGSDKFRNTLALDEDYVAGRSRPHLVVPEKNPSTSTGRAASVAALLVGIGHADPSLSRGATMNRRGDQIYNAERSEVIKAVMLAGADRATENSSSADIIAYRADGSNRMANGMDRRYGAGQLNVYNSHRVLTAGEQDSVEDHASGGRIGSAGFDYDESFGGLGDSNRQATYRFSTGSGSGRMTISLTWNIDIDGGSMLAFDSTAILYDLDLVLYDVSRGDPVIVAESGSIRDNSENIHVELAAGHDYEIRIRPGVDQPPFEWDYGLAWRFSANPK